jgi:hypothetical protein
MEWCTGRGIRRHVSRVASNFHFVIYICTSLSRSTIQVSIPLSRSLSRSTSLHLYPYLYYISIQTFMAGQLALVIMSQNVNCNPWSESTAAVCLLGHIRNV